MIDASGGGRGLAGAVPAAAPFGSALSVRDFALLEDGGLEALAPVMGCDLRWLSVQLPLPPMSPGRQPLIGAASYSQRWDRDVMAVPALDAALTKAREHVLDQIKKQASAVAADLVVGVRRIPGPVPSHDTTTEIGKLARSMVAGATPMLNHALDYQLVGTAVRDPDSRSDEPVLSTLSVSDFAKLRRAGWQPAGVVAGCCHRFGGNVRAGILALEAEGATAIWTSARSIAFDQLREATTRLSAHGVIGLNVESAHWSFKLPGRGRTPTTGVLVQINVIATAIRRAAAPPQSPSNTLRILTLR